MGKFRFIHAADIHLGSFLHIDGTEDHPQLQKLSSEAVYCAFDRICQIAADSKSKFLLLSGDIYDRDARSVRANRFFADCCRKLQKENIQVLLTAGNHDPVREYREIFELPANVHLFSAEQAEIVTVKDEIGHGIASVSGQSYSDSRESRPLHLHYPVSHDRVFRIAMLHTQLESPKSSYIPASLNELTEHPGFDYWALGHIHQPRILNKAKPAVAWSGTAQGRDFGEQGPGGCWLVEADEFNEINMKYQISSPVIFRSLTADIGCAELREADSLDRLEEYLISQTGKLIKQEADRFEAACQGGDRGFTPEGYIIRWEIGGRGALHRYLSNDPQGSEEEICRALRDNLEDKSPFYWTDSVSLRTADPVTDEIQNRHPMLRSLMEQAVLAVKQHPKTREELISTLGQAWTSEINHEEQADDRLSLDQGTLEKIIEQAAQMIWESLAEEGED